MAIAAVAKVISGIWLWLVARVNWSFWYRWCMRTCFSHICCLTLTWFTKNECVAKTKGRGMRGRIVRKAHNSALFRPPWFNWIFSITLCRNTDKYKLQAVSPAYYAKCTWSSIVLTLRLFFCFQLASYMDVRSNEAAPRTARTNGSATYNYLYEKS